MDYCAKLVYGFDFSEGNIPKTKFNLPKNIIEQLIDEDLITSVYSGYGDKLAYLGECLVGFWSGDDMFDAVEEFNKKFTTNKQSYDIAVNVKIDAILTWLDYNGDEKVEDGDLTTEDLQAAKDYFTDLKTYTPSKITISGTD